MGIGGLNFTSVERLRMILPNGDRASNEDLSECPTLFHYTQL